jgi:hypothetical protein
MQTECQIEHQLQINSNRRVRAEDRYLDKLDAAETLIGELCREGKTVYYINIIGKNGYTGKTREGSYADLLGYLIRNGYV